MSLDTSFGDNGKIISGDLLSNYTEAQSIKLYDDKIIIAGYYTSDPNTFVFIARYNLDGTSDTTFGSDGFVLTNYYANTSSYSKIMFIQSDGTIVIVGGSVNFIFAYYTNNGIF